MPEFQYLKPCFEQSDTCNLDWAAVAAIGGWVAAVATLIAVVVALLTASRQTKAAMAAVMADRANSEHIQEREWSAAEKANCLAAAQLARGFARELAYARRQLVPALVNWDPYRTDTNTSDNIERFASDKPFSDLVFIRSCAARLQGFADEDAFALLNVLTAWQFFNSNPGVSLDRARELAKLNWRRLSLPRVQFGLHLLDQIDDTIIKMHRYYREEDAATVVWTNLSSKAQELLKKLRENVSREKGTEGAGGCEDSAEVIESD